MNGDEILRALRSFLFVMPLAALAGALLGPPDPFGQALIVAVALAVGWSLAYRLGAGREFTAASIGAFYLVVLVVVLLGLYALAGVIVGPRGRIIARAGVLLLALGVADVLVFEYRPG
ncbi:MAG: hypothetical protein ABEJ76_05200 [Halanaeroarchaeum sp.]